MGCAATVGGCGGCAGEDKVGSTARDSAPRLAAATGMGASGRRAGETGKSSRFATGTDGSPSGVGAVTYPTAPGGVPPTELLASSGGVGASSGVSVSPCDAPVAAGGVDEVSAPLAAASGVGGAMQIGSSVRFPATTGCVGVGVSVSSSAELSWIVSASSAKEASAAADSRESPEPALEQGPSVERNPAILALADDRRRVRASPELSSSAGDDMPGEALRDWRLRAERTRSTASKSSNSETPSHHAAVGSAARHARQVASSSSSTPASALNVDSVAVSSCRRQVRRPERIRRRVRCSRRSPASASVSTLRSKSSPFGVSAAEVGGEAAIASCSITTGRRDLAESHRER